MYKIRFNYINNSRGAIFVETVIALPLFLVFIFLAIWFGLSINNITSFTSAVANAPRLAATRGQEQIETIPSIGSCLFGEPACDIDQFRNIFCQGEQCDLLTIQDIILEAFSPTLSSGVFNGITSNNVGDFPLSYFYTLAYVFLAMRQSVGVSVYYPCFLDPITKDLDAPGCIACQFLNPETADLTVFDANSRVIPEDKIALRCFYKPKGMVVSVISALLGGSSEDNAVGIITRTGIF